MAETLKELRSIPLEELIRRHDASAPPMQVGPMYYLAEIARRDAVKQTETMLRLTKTITNLTALIFVLTIVNVVAVFCFAP